MSTNAQPDRLALLMAEEILRTIYGDDLKGCAVSLEKIATIISEGARERETQTRELLSMYEKSSRRCMSFPRRPTAAR